MSDQSYADVTERLFRAFAAVHPLPVITAVVQQCRVDLDGARRGGSGIAGAAGPPAAERSAARTLRTHRDRSPRGCRRRCRCARRRPVVRRVERAPSVVMTAAVKEELSGLRLPTLCCRRAEVAALVRVVVAAEVEAGALARRLRMTIGQRSRAGRLTPPSGPRWPGRPPAGARRRVRARSGGPGVCARPGQGGVDAARRPASSGR